MINRSMHAKPGGRGASMNLGFGVGVFFDAARVYGVRKSGAILRRSVLFEVA